MPPADVIECRPHAAPARPCKLRATLVAALLRAEIVVAGAAGLADIACGRLHRFLVTGPRGRRQLTDFFPTVG